MFRTAPCCQDTGNNCNVGIRMRVSSVDEMVALESYRICKKNAPAL